MRVSGSIPLISRIFRRAWYFSDSFGERTEPRISSPLRRWKRRTWETET